MSRLGIEPTTFRTPSERSTITPRAGEYICEKTILLKPVGLSGFIHVEKVIFIIDLLSVAPQTTQITFFSVRLVIMCCVSIFLRISSYYTTLQSSKTSKKVKHVAY